MRVGSNIYWFNIMNAAADEMREKGASRAEACMAAETGLFKQAIGNVDISSDALSREGVLSDYIEHYSDSQRRLVAKSRALDDNTKAFVDAIRPFGYSEFTSMQTILSDARCADAVASYKNPMFSADIVFGSAKDWRRSSYNSQNMVRATLQDFYDHTGYNPSAGVTAFLTDTESFFKELTDEFTGKQNSRRVPSVEPQTQESVSSYYDDCDGYYGEDY